MINISQIEDELGHQLSDEQKLIMNHQNDHALSIVACAGSGKTTTIETKMIYDIVNEKVNPENVLCVTFSKRSQLDMEEKYARLYETINDEKTNITPNFSTFHALFKFLIDRYIKVDYSKVVSSFYEYQQQFMKMMNYESDSGVDLRIVLTEIFSYYGYNINTMLSPDGIAYIEDVPHNSNFTLNEYKQVIQYYKKLKKENNAIDFEDMQLILYDVLDSNKPLEKQMAQSIINYFNEQYQHIYVDEFQDISTIQYSILRQLIDENYHKLIVVGDDDQSIYGFRGSNPNFILDFKTEVENSETLLLSTNYRCKSRILDKASSMIDSNKVRFDKSINAFNTGGYIEVINDNELSQDTLSMISKDMKNNQDETHAILCRHNIQLALIADLLVSRDIPVILNRYNETSLQSHYLYNDLIDTIDAVKYNDLDAFKRVFHKLLMYMRKKDKFEIIEKAKKDKMHWFNVMFNGNYWHKSNNRQIKAAKESMETISSAQLLFEYAFDLLSPYYIKMENEKSSNQYSQLTMIKDHVLSLLTLQPRLSYEDFLEQEKEKMLDLMLNYEQNEGLTLITFHSAKGLEFDNVYIINANHNVTPGSVRIFDMLNKPYLDQIKGAFSYLEEERRLFYVACTRAKNKLIVSHLNDKQSIFVDELLYGSHLNVLDAIKKLPFFYDMSVNLSHQILNDQSQITDRAQHMLKPYIDNRLFNQLIQTNEYNYDYSNLSEKSQQKLIQYYDSLNM